MTDPNDTDGTDRMDAVAGLILDEITDTLHNNADIAGELNTSQMPSSDMVVFYFTDGRTITVRLDISPKS
jgi:hypothetical protein